MIAPLDHVPVYKPDPSPDDEYDPRLFRWAMVALVALACLLIWWGA